MGFFEEPKGMLILTRREGEGIMIGDDVEVHILSHKGNKVRIGVKAPRDVSVHREEVYDRIIEEESQKESTGTLALD